MLVRALLEGDDIDLVEAEMLFYLFSGFRADDEASGGIPHFTGSRARLRRCMISVSAGPGPLTQP